MRNVVESTDLKWAVLASPSTAASRGNVGYGDWMQPAQGDWQDAQDRGSVHEEQYVFWPVAERTVTGVRWAQTWHWQIGTQ